MNKTTVEKSHFALFYCMIEVNISLIGCRNYKYEEFEDNKGVIRIRKWKDIQHNYQKKKDKNDLQNITYKTNSGALEELLVKLIVH